MISRICGRNCSRMEGEASSLRQRSKQTRNSSGTCPRSLLSVNIQDNFERLTLCRYLQR